MKKIVSVLLVIMLISVFAAGCGSNNTSSTNGNAAKETPKETPKAATNEEPAAENVTLSYWTLTNNAWIEPAIADFEAANPNVKIEMTQYATDPIKEALKVAANSKTLPDMWFTWGGSLGSFYPENGLTLDLTQIATDHQWSNLYNQAAIDMSTYDGKISGVPWALNVMDMWYSKEVYEKLGMTPPTTFEEFEAQLATMKDNDIVPMSFGGKGGWHIMRFVEQLIEQYAGPELHDKLNAMEASWNDPAVVSAFAKLKEYSDKGYFPKGHVAIDQAEAINYFYPAKAGVVIEGPWLDVNITKTGFDNNNFGTFKYPGTTRASVFAEMIQFNANLEGAKKDAAIKFAEYVTSTEVINKYIDVYGTPAALNVEFPAAKPNVKGLLDLANTGGFLVSDQALPQEVVQKLFEVQDRIALGEWTPQQAAEAMDQAINEYKSKNK